MGGGKDIKREMDAPQRPQEITAAKGNNAPREAATNDPQGLADMTEDLDSFFQDA